MIIYNIIYQVKKSYNYWHLYCYQVLVRVQSIINVIHIIDSLCNIRHDSISFTSVADLFFLHSLPGVAVRRLLGEE